MQKITMAAVWVYTFQPFGLNLYRTDFTQLAIMTDQN